MSNNKKTYVSFSTDVVSNDKLLDYISDMELAGADLVHCDVMDGIVVQKTSLDVESVNTINQSTNLPIELHLMIDNARKKVKEYLKVKPYAIILQYDYFTYESHLRKTLKKIRKNGINAGIAISPKVPITYILPFIPYLDILCIMGVTPGKSGQKMDESTILKVKQAKEIRDRFHSNMLIEFDGGVNVHNAKTLRDAGVDILVSGSYVYKAFSREYAISALKNTPSIILD